ncbi:MAG: anthranilate synthase component I family protein [Candidatus Omnitrophica bacterium]|nr:anthranilate synthase component I family protein [Candidatus Omnitrophota bacterium]
MTEIASELLGCFPDTMAVLGKLAAEPGVCLLDSSDASGWSYIGVRPVQKWLGHTLADWQDFRADAAGFISAPAPKPGAVPFPAGFMGAVSYDLGLLLEGVGSRHPDTTDGLPLFHFGYYESVLAFCHLAGTAYICGRADSPSWQVLAQAVKGDQSVRVAPPAQAVTAVSDQDEAGYVRMVGRALELIKSGEIYEVNCSRRFRLPWSGEAAAAYELYRNLRSHSPVPYGAYYSADGWRILSASPEMFLELKSGGVATRPMKGTRPRGRDAVTDEIYRRELIDSPKERAELLMVTDLLRNDLGKVCQTGSVLVRDLRSIEAYRGVFQATSCVAGQLLAGKTAFDLFAAAFPGGSVTGCPKHRALRAIDDLELSRRGYYTGALGMISCYGDMSLNVLIRSIVLSGGQAVFSTGGGIVADSDPGSEFAETTLKAEGMLAAF